MFKLLLKKTIEKIQYYSFDFLILLKFIIRMVLSLIKKNDATPSIVYTKLKFLTTNE